MTGSGTCLFVMLNPSTADAEQDDPTIRRCIGFAQSWGYQRLVVGNLFAYRATDPRDLLAASEPIGPYCDHWLLHLLDESSLAVAAWGAHAMARDRARQVRRTVFDRMPYKRRACLGTTKDGHPRHPLYVRADTKPVPFASQSTEEATECR